MESTIAEPTIEGYIRLGNIRLSERQRVQDKKAAVEFELAEKRESVYREIVLARLPEVIRTYAVIMGEWNHPYHPDEDRVFDELVSIEVPGLIQFRAKTIRNEAPRYYLPMISGTEIFFPYSSSTEYFEMDLFIVLAEAKEMFERLEQNKVRMAEAEISVKQDPVYQDVREDNQPVLIDELVRLVRDVVKEQLEEHNLI